MDITVISDRNLVGGKHSHLYNMNLWNRICSERKEIILASSYCVWVGTIDEISGNFKMDALTEERKMHRGLNLLYAAMEFWLG